MTGDAAAIVRIGRRMHEQGWVPATAGNLSCRTTDGILVTVSGRHKGYLTEQDTMRVGIDGQKLPETADGGRPSAETLLHCHLYRRLDWVGAVLHGHSVPATVVSMIGGDIQFEGFEIQKALGSPTHEASMTLPVFDNDQDIARLAERIDQALPASAPGYVLRGHGVYAWGRTIDDAFHRLEALEFLLRCKLEQMRIRS